MTYDFVYIAHMASSCAATLIMKFASLLSPVYDHRLSSVVALEEMIKATTATAGGLLRSDNTEHQQFYQSFQHLRQGFLGYNRCTKHSWISEEPLDARRGNQDTVKELQTKLQNQVKDTDAKTVQGPFPLSKEEQDNLDMTGQMEGPLRRHRVPYVVESSDKLEEDVKCFFSTSILELNLHKK